MPQIDSATRGRLSPDGASCSYGRIVGSSSDTHGGESRLGSYVETLTQALGHADRASPFRSYCAALLLPGVHKSVEPWPHGGSRADLAASIPPATVLADAGYGIGSLFRDGITALGLTYAVGIQSHTGLWPPGIEPLPAKTWSGRGRRQSLIRLAKYRPSTLPDTIGKRALVGLTKLRWRIERDDQELGLGDYEGRGWRGFHHHATLCIAAFGFLIVERGALPHLNRVLAAIPQNTCSIQRLPTSRLSRSSLSATSLNRSPRSESPWPGNCPNVTTMPVLQTKSQINSTHCGIRMAIVQQTA